MDLVPRASLQALALDSQNLLSADGLRSLVPAVARTVDFSVVYAGLTANSLVKHCSGCFCEGGLGWDVHELVDFGQSQLLSAAQVGFILSDKDVKRRNSPCPTPLQSQPPQQEVVSQRTHLDFI